MKIVFLKENKNECRVALLPDHIGALSNKFDVYISRGYGESENIEDGMYTSNGIKIASKNDIKTADIIVKLSALTKSEAKLISDPKQILITNMYLANNVQYLKFLLKRSISSLAIELYHENEAYLWAIKNSKMKAEFAIGGLTKYVESINKKGKLDKYVATLKSFDPITSVVVNYSYETNELVGQVLRNNNNVILLESDTDYENSIRRNVDCDSSMGKLTVLKCTFDVLMRECKNASVLINTTTLPGDKTHLKITSDMIQSMPEGGIYVDLGADQGFGSEITTRPNTFKKPFTITFGKLCIAPNNIPSIYDIESSSYTSKFMTYLLNMFSQGTLETIKNNHNVREAMQTFGNELTSETIAKALTLKYIKL
ncbi:MAG: hypothetical protein Ta2E_03230 [Mycoplasmoidaceae bacterium]|nr:MAG: hypothetical protein Ta2E_03230 [Mycoplasmoidaceae bacterium]